MSTTLQKSPPRASLFSAAQSSGTEQQQQQAAPPCLAPNGKKFRTIGGGRPPQAHKVPRVGLRVSSPTNGSNNHAGTGPQEMSRSAQKINLREQGPAGRGGAHTGDAIPHYGQHARSHAHLSMHYAWNGVLGGHLFDHTVNVCHTCAWPHPRLLKTADQPGLGDLPSSTRYNYFVPWSRQRGTTGELCTSISTRPLPAALQHMARQDNEHPGQAGNVPLWRYRRTRRHT